jgi:HEPN domain-containing protein
MQMYDAGDSDGDGVADDAAICDFDCSPVLCGDGYPNQAADEGCDAGDADGDGVADNAASEHQILASVVGDGVRNPAAGEVCDGSEGCDDDAFIMTEGVALYDSGRAAILVPELTPAQRLELAQVSFTRYFEHAAQLHRSFARNLAHGSYAIAAFELHQVAETIYKAVLLVFTAYQPKLHDLAELGRRCVRVAPDIGPLVPIDAPDRERLAGFLRAAYVDARYSFSFDVSREELEALARYVCVFRGRAERACRERLVELAAAARVVAGGNP